jgi:hypothetical protein
MNTNTLNIGSRKAIKCNTCNLKTNHELKAIHVSYYEDDSDSDSYWQPSWWTNTEYRLWACLGCNTAVLEMVEIISAFDGEIVTYYPSRKGGYLIAKHFVKLDDKLNAVYREVIESFNAQLRITCSIGLRALLEGICVSKGITDREAFALGEKLEKLGEKGLLPTNVVKSLYSFKFIGDEAAHRLEAPTQDELRLAIEVMEDLLNFLYDVEYRLTSKAQELENKRFTKIAEVKEKKIKK